MMCQIIGRPPISNIGFGLADVSSAIRVPRPPARITACNLLNFYFLVLIGGILITQLKINTCVVF